MDWVTSSTEPNEVGLLQCRSCKTLLPSSAFGTLGEVLNPSCLECRREIGRRSYARCKNRPRLERPSRVPLFYQNRESLLKIFDSRNAETLERGIGIHLESVDPKFSGTSGTLTLALRHFVGGASYFYLRGTIHFGNRLYAFVFDHDVDFIAGILGKLELRAGTVVQDQPAGEAVTEIFLISRRRPSGHALKELSHRYASGLMTLEALAEKSMIPLPLLLDFYNSEKWEDQRIAYVARRRSRWSEIAASVKFT